MSPTTTAPTRPARRTPAGNAPAWAAWRGSARRVTSLAGAEALLLRRNPLGLFNAVATPALMVMFVRISMPPDLARGLGLGGVVVTSLTALTLLIAVYYNLVTVLVARREGLVLKRLRTGECGDAEILTGTAAPAIAVSWAQVLAGAVAAVTVLGMPMPVNAALIAVAVVAGTAVFVLLAAASTALTRTVEMAQITTTPLLIASMLSSGLFFPVTQLPDPVQTVARVMPLTPVVELLHLGLTGTTAGGGTVGLAGSFGAAAVPILVLVSWTVAGVWATRRWFRWEPRR